MKEFRYTPAQRAALKILSGNACRVMLFGGSRSGKTFLLCCALLVRALRAPGSRHAVIRRHFNSVKTSVGMDTLPKALECRFPGVKADFNRSECFFRLPNGAEIWLIGLDDDRRAEKILGKEFSTLYFNECSELDYSSVQTALTRLAQNAPPLRNKALFDCNPPGKTHWTYRLFIEKVDPVDRTALADPRLYVAFRINPADNAENLPEDYIKFTLANLPARQRERFLEGRFLDETPGALWSIAEIDAARVLRPPEDLVRIVIGVDPAVTCTSGSDSTGIVAAAVDDRGEYYVLRDASGRLAPLDWGHRVAELYRELGADRIVGEVNNGGDLIEAMLRQIDPDLSFRAVSASRGKIVRAEPVAALYEKNRVHHVGIFPELEDQMTGFSPATSAASPDRMDALVWAITELERDGTRFVLA
ncbi:MAG: phage terminase large subunit [Victivallaceae bacterium]|nr:phage terminase large subunit [Victivallaceae bacterium]